MNTFLFFSLLFTLYITLIFGDDAIPTQCNMQCDTVVTTFTECENKNPLTIPFTDGIKNLESYIQTMFTCSCAILSQASDCSSCVELHVEEELARTSWTQMIDNCHSKNYIQAGMRFMNFTVIQSSQDDLPLTLEQLRQGINLDENHQSSALRPYSNSLIYHTIFWTLVGIFTISFT